QKLQQQRLPKQKLQQQRLPKQKLQRQRLLKQKLQRLMLLKQKTIARNKLLQYLFKTSSNLLGVFFCLLFWKST
ncbi:MAG: hypothetical protein ACI898_002275, partial [Flavobacteriales bacterium]